MILVQNIHHIVDNYIVDNYVCHESLSTSIFFSATICFHLFNLNLRLKKNLSSVLLKPIF